MGRLCAHTHFARGKRVYVRLRDETSFYDRFVRREGRFVTFAARGRVRTRDIDVIGIAKGEARRS